tara:strand:+ start:5670 stop:7571 length:1902 start_codon:yes stop_codon:yes gene_type:complete
MAIFLLLICFFGLVLLLLSLDNTRLSIIKSIVSFSVLTLVVTEFLSLFTSLNYFSLILSWSVINITLIYFIYKKESYKKIPFIKIKFKNAINNLSGFEKFLIGFTVFILAGIFLQGLIYPTNNWDSMAYHMARIIHWIQNESLSNFRTPVYAQLISPPFAEVLILNVNLLFGNDYFSNSVQLLYLVGSGAGISLIGRELGLNRLSQVLSVFILICIPEVVLLGSSTHVELVLSFFMISSIYFMILTIRRNSFICFFFLGISLGLSAATKSTVYVYILPFLIGWIITYFYKVISKKGQIKWSYFLVVIFFFGSINSGHYTRNYKLTNSIIGFNEVFDSYYVNEEHSFKMMVSSVIKNISNQFGIPKIAPIIYIAAEKAHNLMSLDVNNPKISSHKFDIDPLATHENNGANPFYMILILLSLLYFLIFFKRQNRRIIFYALGISLSFLLFCFYLKWSPFVKLHVPFLVLYSLVLAHFIISVFKFKLIRLIVISGFVLNAILILLFNYSRPFITLSPYTSEIKITDERTKKYFSRFLEHHDDFIKVKSLLNLNRFKNIGLMFGEYNLEYPLFTDSYSNDIKPIHLNSFDVSNNNPVKIKVDCIVSTTNKSVIEYDGNMFYNVTKSNDGYLYLFLKK